MDKAAVIAIIKKYLNLLDKEGISIDKAYLYGSYANGEANEDSDIDLLIISKSFNENNDNLIGKIWVLTKKINSKIEPYILGADRFNSVDSSPLVQLVKEEGIEIL